MMKSELGSHDLGKKNLNGTESLIIGASYPVEAPIIAVGAFNGEKSVVLLSGKVASTVVVDTGVDGDITEMTKAA